METITIEEKQFILAKKRVQKLSKFYKHLAIYIIVNTFLSAIIIAGSLNDGAVFTEAIFDFDNYKIWVFWGFGILFQAISLFGEKIFFSKNWEERKIKKYLNK